MPVTSPPSITALPTPPDPADRSTFNARAYPWAVAQQTLATEVAAVASNVYNNASDAATSATTATSAKDSAVGAANFKGAWSSLSGALAIPASVSHSSKVWLLTASVADVTAHTPGVSGNWLDLSAQYPSPSVVGTNTVSSAVASVAFSSLPDTTQAAYELVVESASHSDVGNNRSLRLNGTDITGVDGSTPGFSAIVRVYFKSNGDAIVVSHGYNSFTGHTVKTFTLTAPTALTFTFSAGNVDAGTFTCIRTY